MSNRPNVDVVENFQQAYRFAAGASQQGYSCCICEESYTAGVKLWAHVKQAHPGHPDITNPEDEAETKRRFLHRAYVPKVILL